jgi:hypothetical protein
LTLHVGKRPRLSQALARLMLWSEKSRFNQQVFSGGSVSKVC